MPKQSPRTLCEALRGNSPLGGVLEACAGVSSRVLRGSAGVPRGFTGFSEGSDPVLVVSLSFPPFFPKGILPSIFLCRKPVCLSGKSYYFYRISRMNTLPHQDQGKATHPKTPTQIKTVCESSFCLFSAYFKGRRGDNLYKLSLNCLRKLCFYLLLFDSL